MPFTVVVERSKYLAEQVVCLVFRNVRQAHHEKLVDDRLETDVESYQRLTPIVGDEAAFDDFPQGLPRLVALPDLPPVFAGNGLEQAELCHSISDTLDASNLVAGLKSCCDRDAPARSHLPDVGADHLKTVEGIAHRREHARKRDSPWCA